MKRSTRFALAAMAVVMSVALWTSPAAAAQHTVTRSTDFTFNVVDPSAPWSWFLIQCRFKAESRYNPDTKVIRVEASEISENSFCSNVNAEVRIDVDYTDASGVRRRASARAVDDTLQLERTGVASDPVVTVERDYQTYCSTVYNSDCTADMTFRASPK